MWQHQATFPHDNSWLGLRGGTEHQANEYILLEDLFTAKEIYRQTIEKLANLD